MEESLNKVEDLNLQELKYYESSVTITPEIRDALKLLNIDIPPTITNISFLNCAPQDASFNTSIKLLGGHVPKELPLEPVNSSKKIPQHAVTFFERVLGNKNFPDNNLIDDFNSAIKNDSQPLRMIVGHGAAKMIEGEFVWTVGDKQTETPNMTINDALSLSSKDNFSAILLDVCNPEKFNVYTPSIPIYYGHGDLQQAKSMIGENIPKRAQTTKHLTRPRSYQNNATPLGK